LNLLKCPEPNDFMQMSLFSPEDKKIVELVKHTAAIHIKGNLSLVDRKVLNVLLKNAYSELETAKYHTIRLSEIKDSIGWSGKNYMQLKLSLQRLVDTKIEWNILRKDKKNEWVICSLLAGAKIADGKCIYDYSYHLKSLFKNPNIYSKIDLLMQNNFKSKYSLILWEYLTDYLGTKDVVITDWIRIMDYRDLMGIGREQYKTFKLFNFYLVSAPLEEINRVSGIEAEAECSGRNAEFIRFIIRSRKPETQTIENIEIEELVIDDDKIKAKLLNFCKLSSSTVDQILEKYDPEQLIENIAYIEAESKRGVVKNIAAYSINAIKNDFRLSSQLSLDIKPFKEESKEIKGFREKLKRAFIHNQLDYDLYLNGNDIRQAEGGFLIFVSDKASVRLVEKYSDILEKFKITLEIKK